MDRMDRFECVFFEPTDRRKAIKPFNGRHSFEYASPNLMELRAIAEFLRIDNNIMKTNDLKEIIELSKIISQFVKTLIITRGSEGIVIIKRTSNGQLNPYSPNIQVQVYTTEILNTVENVSGAGDCFASGFIHGVLLKFEESVSVAIGFETAKKALLSKETVPLKLNITHLKNNA